MPLSIHPSDQLSERSHVFTRALQCSEDAEIKSGSVTHGLTMSPIELLDMGLTPPPIFGNARTSKAPGLDTAPNKECKTLLKVCDITFCAQI